MFCTLGYVTTIILALAEADVSSPRPPKPLAGLQNISSRISNISSSLSSKLAKLNVTKETPPIRSKDAVEKHFGDEYDEEEAFISDYKPPPPTRKPKRKGMPKFVFHKLITDEKTTTIASGTEEVTTSTATPKSFTKLAGLRAVYGRAFGPSCRKKY